MQDLPRLVFSCWLSIIATAVPGIAEATEAGVVHDGRALYMTNCSACHGEDGSGEGYKAAGLQLQPHDLRFVAARAEGEFPRWLIEQTVDGRQYRLAHGPDGMPIWGTIFSRQEGLTPSAQDEVEGMIQALVDHIQSMQIELD